jgi:lysylphosphatidylglycerol synthetase-like protein (DUF2156 family)
MGAPAPSPPMPPMPAMPPPMPRSRPIGVTILAILTILVGIGLFLFGIVITALSAVFTIVVPMIGGLGLLLGVLILLVGILMMVSGFGLLRLRMWAWWLAIISFVLGAVSSILSQSWITAAIEILLIVYLVLVRKHFGQPYPM